MDRKKELKAMYKAMQFEMGVFLFRCVETGDGWLGWAANIPAKLNSITMRLNSGQYFVKSLQEQWSEYGEQGFTIETVERLDHEEDAAPDRDYTDDLMALRELWGDKLERVEYL